MIFHQRSIFFHESPSFTSLCNPKKLPFSCKESIKTWLFFQGDNQSFHLFYSSRAALLFTTKRKEAILLPFFLMGSKLQACARFINEIDGSSSPQTSAASKIDLKNKTSNICQRFNFLLRIDHIP